MYQHTFIFFLFFTKIGERLFTFQLYPIDNSRESVHKGNLVKFRPIYFYQGSHLTIGGSRWSMCQIHRGIVEDIWYCDSQVFFSAVLLISKKKNHKKQFSLSKCSEFTLQSQVHGFFQESSAHIVVFFFSVPTTEVTLDAQFTS